MKEILGELFDYYGREPYIILITVNGNLRSNGKAIMSKGCAAEARLKIPGIERLLGAHLQKFGNRLMVTENGYGTFPVKINWWEKPTSRSLCNPPANLAKMAAHKKFADKIFILPRPGCGVGKLQWSEVKPLLEACQLRTLCGLFQNRSCEDNMSNLRTPQMVACRTRPIREPQTH